MTKSSYFFLMIILPAELFANTELNFVPPQLGKFRQCSYVEQCDNNIDCNSVMSCSHIPETSYKCEDKWIKLPFGGKTKIPQANCRKTLNDARSECESNKASEISHCREKQVTSRNVCLQTARHQETDCNLVKEAEVNAALALTRQLERTEIYLAEIDSESVDVQIASYQQPIIIKLIKTKDYNDFFSFLYSEKKYAKWGKIPTLGYSNYRSFVAISNYLILPPGQEISTIEMRTYVAINSEVRKEIGLDGMGQLFIHNPGYLEEYIVSKMNNEI
jgi:hypothetical protein